MPTDLRKDHRDTNDDKPKHGSVETEKSINYFTI